MKKRIISITLVLFLLILSACGTKQEEPTVEVVEVISTNTPEPTEIPKLTPGEPRPEAERTLEDVDSSIKAYENRAVTGDNILNNLYERPFTSEEMQYQPDLNILTTAIVSDDVFIYFTITMDGVDPTTGILTGTYGIEFDRSQTGRGDLLVLVTNPGTEWSMENLTVYLSEDESVGGVKPVVAEEGYEELGYTVTAVLEGDKVAWARLAPEDSSAVQIAVSRALLSDPEEFLWGAWADGGVQDPSLFDYDDHFGPSAAGSPINTDPDYPVKALYSLDNTCRLPYGFEATSGIPGICISIQPVSPGLVCRCIRPCYTYAGCCLEWSCE